jgi:hypothetical protein
VPGAVRSGSPGCSMALSLLKALWQALFSATSTTSTNGRALAPTIARREPITRHPLVPGGYRIDIAWICFFPRR